MEYSEYRHKEDIITTTEVNNKFDMVLYDLTTLEATIKCFERTWNMSVYANEDIETIRSFITMMKSNFQSVTNSQLLTLLGRV